MRTALRRNPSRQQVAVGRSLPAPVGGWDAQNALADMPPENAVILENWIPKPGYIEMRRGYVNQMVGFPAAVETLMIWRGAGAGTDQIFAASGEDIYDASVQGDPLGAAVYTGAASARWQYINFANDAGAFILAVNGVNTPIYYEGTAWDDLAITGSSGPITLTPTSIIDIMAHKRRVFLMENNTMRVWFLAVNAIQGAAELLDLGPIFDKGGSLQCMATWSLDGGQGQDDFAVFMTTQGQVAIYQGNDPSDADNWALVGVFNLGLPLGRRALLKYGADLAVLTTDGVVPLSQALKLDRAQDDLVAITAKIQNAFAMATRSYGDNFGWQGMLYQRGALAIFNVPTAELTSSEQYVQNMQTGAWCRFTGMDAFCWAIANDKPYFGSTEGVFEWDSGSSDGGGDLTADMQTAFNYFSQRGRQKQFTMIRPILRTSQTVAPALELLVDYKSGIPTATPTVVSAPAMTWGTWVWGVSVWPEGEEVRYDWTSVAGIGFCGAARMRVTLTGQVVLVSGDGIYDIDGGDGVLIAGVGPSGSEITVQLIGFDLLFQPGGQL